MSIGSRVREVRLSIRLSQSELARRVGVDQSTIAGLEAGKSRSSAYLHKIARELGTTPAYLTGETDDPLAGAPAPADFSREDIELLEEFSLLSDRARDAIRVLIGEIIATSNRTVHAPRKRYRAQSQGG